LVAMDRLPEAAEKYRRILELEPANADAHFRLALLAIRARRFDVARLELELVQKLDADYPGVSRQMATVMVHTGQIAAARRCLAAVLESIDDDEPDLLGLADLLMAVNLRDEAE